MKTEVLSGDCSQTHREDIKCIGIFEAQLFSRVLYNDTPVWPNLREAFWEKHDHDAEEHPRYKSTRNVAAIQHKWHGIEMENSIL